MHNDTAEALYEIQVECFMAGLRELLPNPETYNLSPEDSKRIRDEVVAEELKRVNWNV